MSRLALVALALSLWWTLAACDTENCTIEGCPSGQTCDRESGLCQEVASAGCIELGCPEGQICDADSGRCLERTFCRSTEDSCQDEESCTTCPQGQICDASTGFCVASGVCQYLDCPLGQICEPSSNQCEAILCGEDEDCPSGSICAEGGACTPGCYTDANCRQGEACTSGGSGQVGSCNTQCTQDPECPWGEVCLQEAGRSRCEPEPPCQADADCRTGESCRQSACQRALCRRDADCLSTEVCLEDTGACVLDLCVPDTLEPNNVRGDAYQLRQGIYSGLTLCGGEEDWFSFQMRGTRALRVSMIHSPDADLDLEAWFGGQRVALAAQDGFVEGLVVPVNYSGEVLLRVFAQQPGQATYQLQLSLQEVDCAEDSYEPNNTLAQAASLRLGRAQRAVSCPGDVDWFQIEGSPGPLTLQISPEGEPALDAPVRFTWGNGEPWLLEPDAEGTRKVSLAWQDNTVAPLLRLEAPQRTPWQLQATTVGPACEDPAPPQRDPESAGVVELDGQTAVLSQERLLCGVQSPSAGLESDWYRLELPEGAAELTLQLTDTTPPTWIQPPELRVTLYAGETPLPWRSARPPRTQPNQALEARQPGVLQAQVSRVDRPLWMRVDVPAGLPSALEHWPRYQHQIQAQLLEGVCVQDRSEGSGNDTLPQATAVQAPLLAILCPNDTDSLLLERETLGDLSQLTLSALESRLTVKIATAPDAEPVALLSVPSGPEGARLGEARGWPQDAPRLWLSLVAEAAPNEGVLYRLWRAQPTED